VSEHFASFDGLAKPPKRRRPQSGGNTAGVPTPDPDPPPGPVGSGAAVPAKPKARRTGPKRTVGRTHRNFRVHPSHLEALRKIARATNASHGQVVAAALIRHADRLAAVEFAPAGRRAHPELVTITLRLDDTAGGVLGRLADSRTGGDWSRVLRALLMVEAPMWGLSVVDADQEATVEPPDLTPRTLPS
jgi:hypothetical protein